MQIVLLKGVFSGLGSVIIGLCIGERITLLSLLIFGEFPPYTYFIALALMVVGAYLCANDEPLFGKKKKS